MTMYTEREIESLQNKLFLLENRLEEEKRLMSASNSKFYRVGCRENNSGGSYWLTLYQYDKLEEAGFSVRRPSEDKKRYYDARGFVVTVAAPNEDIAERIAKEMFYDATGQNPDDQGCNCCGRPFDFEVETADYTFDWEDESDV